MMKNYIMLKGINYDYYYYYYTIFTLYMVSLAIKMSFCAVQNCKK